MRIIYEYGKDPKISESKTELKAAYSSYDRLNAALVLHAVLTDLASLYDIIYKKGGRNR